MLWFTVYNDEGFEWFVVSSAGCMGYAAVSFIKVYIALAQQDMWPGDPFTSMD